MHVGDPTALLQVSRQGFTPRFEDASRALPAPLPTAFAAFGERRRQPSFRTYARSPPRHHTSTTPHDGGGSRFCACHNGRFSGTLGTLVTSRRSMFASTDVRFGRRRRRRRAIMYEGSGIRDSCPVAAAKRINVRSQRPSSSSSSE